MTAQKKVLPKKLLFIFLIIPLLVFVISAFKIVTPNKQTLYVKVKVSQGFWWASTTKPKLWMAKAIKKGHVEYNLLGQRESEIIKVSYYPHFSENRLYEDDYEIYLTLKLLADYNQKSGKAIFKRTTLSVGTPIELDYPTTQITGTVIALSDKPFREKYEEKIVYLTKRFAFPWEYEAISIGDQYHDGEQVVFEVLDKGRTNTAVVSSDAYGNLLSSSVEPTRYITVKAKLIVRNVNGQLLFGEEKIVNTGSYLIVTTDNYKYEGFVISRIF